MQPIYALLATVLALTSHPARSADILGCFAATYDKAHFAKYPGQTPTFLAVLVERQGEFLAMSVTARLRGKTGTWGEAGACSANGEGLKCYIDCDGGGFTLHQHGGGVMLRNAKGFRVAKDGCGESAQNLVDAVPGNRRFALKKAAAKLCE